MICLRNSRLSKSIIATHREEERKLKWLSKGWVYLLKSIRLRDYQQLTNKFCTLWLVLPKRANMVKHSIFSNLKAIRSSVKNFAKPFKFFYSTEDFKL